MAPLNSQYGSELHLLRMLGRHRQYFDRLVLGKTAAVGIEWLDFPSGDMRLDKNGNPSWDREWHQLNFLGDERAKSAWGEAWPKLGPNWDAVGRLSYESHPHEWLLVEAKANLEEVSSSYQAQQDSLKKIRQTMDTVKKALGVPSGCDWLNGYYQYCNRLAVLHIMNTNGAPARLMYVYFYGDKGGNDGWLRTCPSSAEEWAPTLDSQAFHIGLPPSHKLESRIHNLFVDARCLDGSAELPT